MKTMKDRASIKFAILGLIILLSGCDLYMGGVTYSDVRMECPPVTILPEASSITRYLKGANRSIIDVDFSGKITGIKGKCSYELGSSNSIGTVEIDVITKFELRRGAGNKSQQADFQYFVSVLDKSGKMLQKQSFPYSAKFSKKRSWVKKSDSPVILSIPLNNEKKGQDFKVYVGFQLSQEELEFNRKGSM